MKLLVATVIVLAACGSTPAATTTPKEAEGAATVALPDLPFDKLDRDQRVAFMKQKVVPQMKPIFQSHDSKDFSDFGCKTCHGDQAKQGHFDMPNPKLPKLNFKDMSKFDKDDIEWMQKQVEPTMARILDLPLYSKENPKGFSCLNCHTTED